MPHLSLLEDRMYQNDCVRKGTKGQRGHIRCTDTWFFCFRYLKGCHVRKRKRERWSLAIHGQRSHVRDQQKSYLK